MARKRFRSLPVPQADEVTGEDGNGATLHLHDMTDVTVQIKGTFVATVQLQGALTETPAAADWTNLTDRSTTAPVIWQVPETMAAIRTVVSGFTSGLPVAVVGGLIRADF